MVTRLWRSPTVHPIRRAEKVGQLAGIGVGRNDAKQLGEGEVEGEG